MAAPIEIRLFGNVEIRVEGRLISPLRSRKCTLLMAMLTLRNGKEVDREFLASALWAESVQAQAFYNLRQALVALRKSLGREAYRLTTPANRTVMLDLTGGYVDVGEFDRLANSEDVSDLRRAIAVYGGPLLQEFTEDRFIDPREARQLAYVRALAAVAQEYESTGAHSEAVQLMRHAVAIDPWDEAIHRGLMRALASNGEFTAALSAYRDLSDLLYREAHSSPDPETERLYRDIRSRADKRAGEASGIRADTALDLRVTPEPVQIQRPAARGRVEPAGGAMSLDSPYYLARNEDDQLAQALHSGDSIILIKGARHMGKTSLLARGMESARRLGCRVVHTDLETYSPDQMATQDTVARSLAEDLADQLALETTPGSTWSSEQGVNRKLERYLRDSVLRSLDDRVVWAIDSVDALNGRDYSSSIFGLFRSWHNRRALDPEGPWRKLTLALTYSTEAHLLIQDRHQSPFNVGVTLSLSDFTTTQVRELNQRYGAPLAVGAELAQFYHLLSGHPYLTMLALAELCNRGLRLADIVTASDTDDGLFAPHMRRMLSDLRRDPALLAAVGGLLTGDKIGLSPVFYRLRSAGIVVGDSTETAVIRCPLYRSYLLRNLM